MRFLGQAVSLSRVISAHMRNRFVPLPKMPPRRYIFMVPEIKPLEEMRDALDEDGARSQVKRNMQLQELNANRDDINDGEDEFPAAFLIGKHLLDRNLSEAKRLFEEMPKPNTYVCQQMLTAY